MQLLTFAAAVFATVSAALACHHCRRLTSLDARLRARVARLEDVARGQGEHIVRTREAADGALARCYRLETQAGTVRAPWHLRTAGMGGDQ